MKNQLLTIAAFTLLLAGQSASASNNSEEFLSWLNATPETTQVQEFSKVSMATVQQNSHYDAQADAFSLDYSSNK